MTTVLPFTLRRICHRAPTWAIYLSAAVCLLSAARADVTPVYQAFLTDTAAGRQPVLPDYSYAGYQHGERPVPAVKGPIFDVTRFGAVPNSKQPAYAAIQKAIDACEAAGGGVVWFPKGVYQVNPAPSDTDQPRLRISKSGVVLRGEGSGPDGSVLYMEAEIQPENPKKMWSGRPVLLVAPSDSEKAAVLGEVSGAVAMNQRRIPIKAGHTIKPGDRVVLSYKVGGTDTEVLNRYIAPHTWLPEWKNGLSFKERHEVEQVGPDFIVMREVLLTPIKADETWTVSSTRYINNVGIENLRFQGNWKEKFVHHQDWRCDSAWRGFVFNYVENSWAWNCVFADMNWPIQVANSRQCTLAKLTFTGTRGHFGLQCVNSTNILNLAIRDEAGHHHGPSLQNGAAGTVYHGCSWHPEGSFDSHGGHSYASLFELGEGGLSMTGVGGSLAAFPHHLHACVVWNHQQTSKSKKVVDFWPEPAVGWASTFGQPILVGVTGPELDYRNVFLREGGGQRVAPQSLWLAQVKRRLGSIPAYLTGYSGVGTAVKQ
jgi:hypothetical protein